jgi:hypothetical protein
MRYLKYIISGLNPKKFYYISSACLKDFFNENNKVYSNETHAKAAIEWLRTAQKHNDDGGVSAQYSLFEGWADSYVETTGYIISTFFNYAEISKKTAYREEAVQMADFELRNQLSSGAFPGGGKKDMPIIFNTGQVIFGMCRAYEEVKDVKYKKAAEKASDWLLSAMDQDGCWRKSLYLNNIHTYNTRTAWSLLCAHKISKNPNYKKAAEKNLDWALTQQLENGWFQNNGFYPEQEPLIHTIAYSIRGILESAIYLREKKYLEAAIKAATPIMNAQKPDGSLPGSFNKNWESSVKWSCLTGNSQMSIIWQKLFAITKDKKFIDAAKKSNAYMRSVQNLTSLNKGIRGGIAGSFPIYGWYAPFCFINWAAKFFIDALMLEDNPNLANKLS